MASPSLQRDDVAGGNDSLTFLPITRVKDVASIQAFYNKAHNTPRLPKHALPDPGWPSEISDASFFLNCLDEAMFIALPITGIALQLHLTILPSSWGKSVLIGRSMCHWLFQNTQYSKIMALFPVSEKLVERMVENGGFIYEGLSENATMFKSKLEDMEIWGIDKFSFYGL